MDFTDNQCFNCQYPNIHQQFKSVHLENGRLAKQLCDLSNLKTSEVANCETLICDRCAEDLEKGLKVKVNYIKHVGMRKKQRKYKKFEFTGNKREETRDASASNTSSSVIVDKSSDSWSESELGDSSSKGMRKMEPLIFNYFEREMKLKRDYENKLKIPRKNLDKYYKFEAQVLAVLDIKEFYVRDKYEETLEEEFLIKFQRLCDMNINSNTSFEVPVVGLYGVVEIKNMWYRCKVVEIADERLTVFLVDFGRYEHVEHLNLKPIDDEMRKFPQIAIKCCLADVLPLQENNNSYPQQAIDQFRKLATDSNRKVKVLVTQELSSEFDDSPIPMGVEITTNSKQKINFNAVLVSGIKCAISSGGRSEGHIILSESDNEEEDQLENCQISLQNESKTGEDEPKTRVPVKILKVIDPTEFYVQVMSREEELEKLSRRLQRAGRNQETDQEAREWAVNDYCLVKYASTWHRGLIIKIELQISVYLLDIGLEIFTTAANITTIPERYKDIHRGAIKVHLEAFPKSSKQWGMSAIDTFKMLTSSFESYVISVVGFVNDQNSYPVLLWGVGEENLMLGVHAPKPLYNILLYLVTEGYVYTNSMTRDNQLLYDEYLVKESTFEVSAPQFIKTAADLSRDFFTYHEKSKGYLTTKIGELDVEITPKKIDSWLPAQVHEIGDTFRGTASYVDKDGAIYICDMKNLEFMQEMPDKTTSIYKMMQNNVWDILKPKDPVIVPYRDGKYYRGVIVNQSPKSDRHYFVRYVDFGDVRVIHRSEIFQNVIAYNVPVLASRYVLDEVLPLGDTWKTEFLNHLHALIVDKTFTVIVTEDTPYSGVKGVKITDINEQEVISPNRDLSEFLLNSDAIAYFQIQRRNRKIHKWPAELKFTLTEDSWEMSERDKHMYELRRNHEERQRMEDIMLAGACQGEYYIASIESMKEALKYCDPLNSAINSIYSGFQPSVSTADAENLNYDRKYNRRRSATIMKKVPFFDLRSTDVEEFACIFLDCNDSGDLQFFIEPLMPDLQNQLKSTFSNLKSCESGRFRNPAKACKKLCVIECNGEYKRGEVISTDRTTAKVYLIDENKTIIHPFNELYHMDMQSRKCPRRIIVVKFYGIAMHAPVRYIAQHLQNKCKDSKLRAVLRGYSDEDLPLIELYDDTGMLIYEDLIQKEILYRIN